MHEGERHRLGAECDGGVERHEARVGTAAAEGGVTIAMEIIIIAVGIMMLSTTVMMIAIASITLKRVVGVCGDKTAEAGPRALGEYKRLSLLNRRCLM